MEELRPGTQIGPYRIEGVAGRGAVGIVYRAEHTVLGRTVAVKTLNPVYADEGVFRERFSREAQGAAAVHHPNIISVFDAGEHQRIPYLVMTYVDGPDLERVLADRGGRLEAAEAVLICAAVADALDAAGAEGLAHRDVKPANILLEGWEPERYGGPRRRPHVYLTDFGLIKSSAQATVTRTGQFVGTLLYMSPEQIESRAVPGSDQYSLACVMWECLTGTYPFEPIGGSTLSLLSQHLHDPVPPFTERPGGPWPPALESVFRRALAKRPADRYPTCAAFVDDATRTLGLGRAAPRSTPEPPLAALRDIGPSQASPTDRDPAPPTARLSSPPPTAAGPPPPLADAVATGTTADGPRPAENPSSPHPPAAGGTRPPGGGGPPTAFPPGLPTGRPGGLAADRSAPRSGRGGRGVVLAVAAVALVVVAAIVAWVVLARGDDAAGGTGDGDGDDVVVDAPSTDLVGGGATVDDAVPLDVPSELDVPPEQQGRVAFVADGDVWVSTVDGGDVANVTAGAHAGVAQPSWRPGADELVVTTDDGLVLLDADGGGATRLTVAGAHSDPAWDPTGEQVVFSTPAADGQRDLGVVTPGQQPQVLGLPDRIEADGGVIAQRPTWSPDGRVVTFHLAGPDGALSLWSVDASGSDPVPVEGVADGPAFHPAYTASGDLLYSRRPGGPSSAAVVELLDLPAATSTTVAEAGDVDAKDADPSPCGDWVAYQVDSPDGPRIAYRELRTAEVAGPAGEVPLPEGVTATTDPAWAGQPCTA